MSRRGICHIWFRGRHISPSMPYREARSVAKSSEGPTASKSDRTGRNPGMTRLVRRSSAGVWRYCVFLSCSNIPSAHAQVFWLFDKKLTSWLFFFLPAIDISVDFIDINVSMRYFAGRTGWPDTYEKNYEMRIGSLPLSCNGRITQNSFWA